MEKLCEDEIMNQKILLDLHALTHPDSEKVIFGIL
jgi:hypothetical protein